MIYGMKSVPRRRDLERLVGALGRAPAVALLGPRQVGKTTLAGVVAAEFPGTLYLDLEKASDLRKLTDAGAFLRERAGRLTVIDEVHRAPSLFAELRSIIDERRTRGERVAQFLLLGSASLDLVQSASETLAGRVEYLELGPLSVEDIGDTELRQDDLWLRGGFPESALALTDEDSYRWRRSFVRSYLERDVPMFAPRLPGATIGRLWTMLANAQGSLLNNSRLALSLGVSAPTIGNYIDLLCDLLLVRRVQPWSGNLGKRLVKSPKVYVRDSGIVHALLEIESLDALLGHPVLGLSWEGFVVESLARAVGNERTPLFYRTQDGSEIDLVFERGGKPVVAVEIKRGSAPKLQPGFARACADLGIPHRLVVYSGAEDYPIKDGVHVHSLSSAIERLRTVLR
jgi:predicted AAA+ superfamily ATPase